MAEWQHRKARINGLDMHYVEQGTGLPVIFCHGFPLMWFSWYRQLNALAGADYRVVAPDMRGMGLTTAPEDPAQYDIEHTNGDLLGLLDELNEPRAVFVGIDFGALAIYDLAMMHPERVIAVIGLQNPAARHNPQQSPLQEYAEMAKKHFVHIDYFNQPGGVADRALNEQPREFLRRLYWALSGSFHYLDLWKYPPGTHYLDALPETPPLPWPWLSELELEFHVSAYSHSGFTGGLNWYRSMDLKWEQRKAWKDKQSRLPSYFMCGERSIDLEALYKQDAISLMALHFPNLRRADIIPGGGHIIQLECSDHVNKLLLEYLEDIRRNDKADS